MKKLLIVLSIISFIFILTKSNEEYVIVPNESIRFRIIPASNTLEDITMKEEVKKEISSYIENIELSSTSLSNSRKEIKNSIPEIENRIHSVFDNNSYNKDFKVKYGLNYFPEKIYKGVKYPSGNYESMVVEIGEAKGDNYWCVLFPPLCMIDAEESEEKEYSFFISEIIKKYFK